MQNAPSAERPAAYSCHMLCAIAGEAFSYCIPKMYGLVSAAKRVSVDAEER